MLLQVISIPLMEIRQLKQFVLKETKPYNELLKFFKNSKNFLVISKNIFKFNQINLKILEHS